jgi:hypothetical protein
MSLTITFGWLGLMASSPAIGAIAGPDKANLPQALLIFPLFSLAMVCVHLVLRGFLLKNMRAGDGN